MSALVQKFLAQIRNLVNKHLTYRQPGDGSDGTCDCIGLIIGAIRRMGLKWTGIHGSNYSARKAMVLINKILSVSQLEPGDIVYKAYDPGTSKWNLPSRYRQGGQYYNGDLKDYYHVGVVTSINPLKITHMTSPTTKVDTSLGKWGYFGKLRLLCESSTVTTQPTVPATTVQQPEASTGVTATVTASSGRYVKMRQQPSQNCKLYDEVPIGAKVTLVQPGETWAQINYGKRKGWYMMAKFLDVGGKS